MSDDVNGAPSDGAANEVVQQVEAQVETADTQAEQEKPSSSAREAVERAFAKLDKPAEEPAKAEPTKADRQRDEGGKFVKAEKAEPVKVEQQVQQEAELKAPSRFAKAAQDAWAQTPEPVRQEAERAIAELTQGIEKYKGAAEAFEPIRKYHDMATQSGTTLDKALDSYVGIEQAWRANPAQGFMAVCQNMGHDPMQVLTYIAQQIQGGNVQAQPRGDSPEVSELKKQLEAFEQKFGTLEKTLTETQQQAQQREVQTKVEAFAKDHPYFDDLADTIAQMLETKFAKDLPDAYEKAVRLNPEVAAKIEAEKAAKAVPKPDPAQTREKANKSITGTPTSGSNPATRKVPGSAREALQGAFAQVGL